MPVGMVEISLWVFSISSYSLLLFHAVHPLNRGLLDSHHEGLISQMLSNIYATLSKFDLDNKIVIYAICPRCHCTYAPYISPGETVTIYPSHCTNHTDPSSNQCGQPRLRCKGLERRILGNQLNHLSITVFMII